MRLLFSFFFILFLSSCDERLGSLKTLDMDTIEVEELETALPVGLPIENPTSGYAHLPRLKADGNQLYMSWVEQEDSLSILKYAVYADARWSPPETIASGTDWFVNWADFPALAINKGTLMATFLQKSAEGTYDYDIKYTLRNQETGSWSLPKTLHNDHTAAEHGFVSLVPYEKGFFATWLDGRNTKPSEGGHDNHGRGGSGAMTLRAAMIDVKGKVTKRTELDNRICDCCNTSAALTKEGIAVVYRDRSETAIETRDIYRTIWQGKGWTIPTPVHTDNWEINGCPVNGRAIDARDTTAVAAWFSAAKDIPSVQIAFSHDSGLNFGTPTRVDAGNAIGRVDVTLLEDKSALVLWMEPEGKENLLQLKRVYPNGIAEPAQTITQMSSERMSGFPQLERIGNSVYIAWTDAIKDAASVRFLAFEI